MCLARSALLALLLGMIMPAWSHAQNLNTPEYPEKAPKLEKEASPFRPGVQGGLNVSDYSNEPDVGSNSLVGYIAGLELECRLSSTWFLQPEVRVVQKGFTYNLNSGGSVTNFDTRINYLEVPILVKAKFRPDALIQPFVFLGPNVGFKISTNIDVTSGGNFVPGPPLEVLFHTVDFSLDGGLGGEYHFARRMAGFLELRGTYGLNNVSTLAGTNWKSRNFQFVFGGLFDL
ncbi:MAG: porin family protein [Bdellovibrionia bacterium]